MKIGVTKMEIEVRVTKVFLYRFPRTLYTMEMVGFGPQSGKLGLNWAPLKFPKGVKLGLGLQKCRRIGF